MHSLIQTCNALDFDRIEMSEEHEKNDGAINKR